MSIPSIWTMARPVRPDRISNFAAGLGMLGQQGPFQGYSSPGRLSRPHVHTLAVATRCRREIPDPTPARVPPISRDGSHCSPVLRRARTSRGRMPIAEPVSCASRGARAAPICAPGAPRLCGTPSSRDEWSRSAVFHAGGDDQAQAPYRSACRMLEDALSCACAGHRSLEWPVIRPDDGSPEPFLGWIEILTRLRVMRAGVSVGDHSPREERGNRRRASPIPSQTSAQGRFHVPFARMGSFRTGTIGEYSGIVTPDNHIAETGTTIARLRLLP